MVYGDDNIAGGAVFRRGGREEQGLVLKSTRWRRCHCGPTRAARGCRRHRQRRPRWQRRRR